MSRRSVKVTTRRGRWYTDADARPYWSVTTILGILPKPWMEAWASKMAAEYAVEHLGEIVSQVIDGERDEALKAIKGASRRYSRSRMDIGSDVHNAIEAHVLGKPMPPIEDEEVEARMQQFGRFLEEFAPIFEASELTVFNRTENYAGTLDAVVVIDGERLMLDIKTGSGVYPEAALQLAMYRHAEFFQLRDGEEHPVPATAGGVILHLEADAYSLVPMVCDEEIFKMALYAREVYRWQADIQNDVVLAPMPPPVVEADEAEEPAQATMLPEEG